MSTFSVCFCAYSVFLLLDCLTEVRLSEYADFDAVNICIDVSNSVLCSSITHRWWSNTGGSDSGKGSPVNLDSSEHLISELPECTDRAEVNKTMYPIPVIGPSPFWYFEKKKKMERPVCQHALQSRSWCCELGVLCSPRRPWSDHSLASICCAEVGWKGLHTSDGALDYGAWRE